MTKDQKTTFLTRKMQLLLEEIYKLKKICFKTQYVYKDQQSFRIATDRLREVGFIKSSMELTPSGKFTLFYRLTMDGGILWEGFLSLFTKDI